jgi:MFS transporter, SP family, galactose:H+ symporter
MWKWLAASGIFLYLLSFSIGMGSTPWTVNSEIYPLHLRGIGNSIVATTNWVSNFTVSIFFLTLLKEVNYVDIEAFLLILGFTAIAFLFDSLES